MELVLQQEITDRSDHYRSFSIQGYNDKPRSLCNVLIYGLLKRTFYLRKTSSNDIYATSPIAAYKRISHR